MAEDYLCVKGSMKTKYQEMVMRIPPTILDTYSNALVLK